MPLEMGLVRKKFSQWFSRNQAELKAQAAELEAKVTQNHLSCLPPSQIKALSQQIDGLSVPSSYVNSIKSKLAEAIAQWQEEDNAANSLIVLASPTEPLGKILTAIVEDEDNNQDLLPIKSLSWTNRPQDYSQIKSQLLEELDLVTDVSPEQQQHQVVNIIPDLGWCFLRCVDGLETIEYLQELLFRDRSRFWLIGCNTWTWQYLDIVCQLGGGFKQILYLPDLQDIEIKEWLTPVSQTVQLELSQDKDKDNGESELENNWISSSEQSYFEHLKDISLGLSSVAAKLWLLSLGIKKPEKQEEESDSDNDSESEDENNSSVTTILGKATLPDLPQLTKDDRYLLFSLGLHGEMNLFELALSLGDRKTKVQNQLQVLFHSGILERKQDLFRINPAYYPRLRRDLINNNFLVERGK